MSGASPSRPATNPRERHGILSGKADDRDDGQVELAMGEDGHEHSRAVSWVAVAIILAGFALGGIGLILGTWWLFWTALGVVVAGGILAIAIDIFADVELDPLHPGDSQVSPIRHELAGGDGTGELEAAPTEPSAASPDVASS